MADVSDIQMTFEERVSQNMLKLNDVEDDIVDYLRRNAGKLDKLSIKTIANEMYIAPNTLVRFAKKLGYRGFAELKFSVSQHVDSPAKRELEKMKEFLEPELSKHIIKTAELIDPKQIRTMLNRIYTTRRVALFGMGDSRYFCELLAKYFSRVNDNVEMRFHIINDDEYCISRLREGDVAIFISASGESKWTLELAEMACRQKSYVVSITMDTDNTLRRIADCPLIFSSEDKYYKNYNVPDLTGLMLLIRYIANTYWNSYLLDEGK